MQNPTSAIVGALACQKNSFLKTLQTEVVSCKEYQPIRISTDKQKQKQKQNQNQNQNQNNDISPLENKLYALELKNTVLFPEGGGQPSDKGIIETDSEKVPVNFVLRQGLIAIHVTPKLIEPGSKVTLQVDWKRRFDIMQQHTGQHLLSAVLDTYNLNTLSWSMGDQINYIELPQKVDQRIVQEVSEKVNDLIVENLPIKVTTPDKLGKDIDISHIPDDYDMSKGIVRVVQIGAIDSNPCCGTHLTATGQIQAVSLLHQTNVRGGNSRLHFICGSRVWRQLTTYHTLLKETSGMQLSCQIEEIPSKVADLNANYKKSVSREIALLKELAVAEAAKVYKTFRDGTKKFAYIYRQDSAPEYLNLVQKELSILINANKNAGVDLSAKQTVVYINGDYMSGTGGMVKISGPLAECIQAEIKSLIKNIRGGGKGTTYQGKIVKYEKGEIETVLRYLESLTLP